MSRWAVRGLKLHVLLEWLVCVSSSGEGEEEEEGEGARGKEKRHGGAVSVIWPSQTAVSALNSDGHAGSNRDWRRRNRRIARKRGEKNDCVQLLATSFKFWCCAATAFPL